MTRQETEEKIMEHLQEIVKIYSQYKPDGNYLMMTYHRNCLSVHNEHWDADSNKQINAFLPFDFKSKGSVSL